MRPDRSYRTILVSTLLLFAVVAAVSLGYGLSGELSSERLATVMLINMVLVVGLQIFVGNTGIVSFGHLVVPAVAAYTAAILVTPTLVKSSVIPDAPLGLETVATSPVIALLAGLGVGTLFGALVGIAVSRLSGLGATIFTLALLVVVHQVLTNWVQLTGGAESFYGIPQEATLPITLVGAFFALAVARLFKESRQGLRAHAVREDELAATAMGLSASRTRFVAWVLSAPVGALGGVLLAFYLGAIAPDTFYLDLTLIVVAFLLVGGMQSVAGAALGTILLTALLEVTRDLADGPVVAGIDLPAVYGLSQLSLGGILIGAMIWRPRGIFGDRELDDLSPVKAVVGRWAPSSAPGEEAEAKRPPAAMRTQLRAESVSMNFDGIQALEGVSLEVSTGEIIGVIGPNGAGKTTLLNVLSSNLIPSGGRVTMAAAPSPGRPGDEDTARGEATILSELGPAEVARHGISRTFQNLRLFEGLTTFDNVEVAVDSASRHRGDVDGRSTAALLADFDLVRLAERKVATLAQGDRRRVEMARAVGLRPRFVLLDEPTAGLNDQESEDLLRRFQTTQQSLSFGAVVVDHNIPFVMNLCQRLYVLDSGRLLASGSPSEIQEHPEVIDAYLGKRRPMSAAG